MNRTRRTTVVALCAATLMTAVMIAALPPIAAGATIPIQSTTWAPTGPAASAHFGFSVATAGDVNGDGFSDVIVGAPYYGNGRAWVYYGGVDMDDTPDWTVGGPASSGYGWCVAPAGDVNGDGYDDVLVGAPGGVGFAFCYHGSASGLEGVPAWYVTSASGSNFGYCVATAGDINGDGYSDVLVGAPTWGGQFGRLGRAQLFLGGPTGLEVSSSWGVVGTDPAELGRSVASAGDVNADGYDDFLVGDPGYDTGILTSDRGRVQLFLGDPSGTPVESSWNLIGPGPDARYGEVLAPAGDVDRDGYADAMMGSPRYSNYAGRVVFLKGNATGFTAQWTRDGAATSGYGHSIAPAGDLDGNGYADVVVSTLFGGSSQEGHVDVLSGTPGGLMTAPTWEHTGSQASANFGRSVATAGDVDGDGFADLLIGEDFYDDGGNASAGRVHLFRGATAGIGVGGFWSRNGQQDGEHYGMALTSPGDVNADGFEDLLVGSPLFDGTGGAETGRVELIYGSDTGLDAAATTPWSLEGDAAGDGFGFALSSAGDINNDGFDDFLVGVPGDDTRGSDAGQARLYYGGASGPSSTPAWASDVGSAGDSMGTAVAAAGDVNGDGYRDVIIGSGAYGSSGAAFCYMGTPTGLSPTPAWMLAGPQAGSRFGFAMGSADRDGDGYTDVFIGLPGWDGAEVDEGRVLGYRGGPAGLDTTPTWDWDGSTIAFVNPAAGIQLGYAVCGVSNPTGGTDGVAFSAPWYLSGGTVRGYVRFEFDDVGPDGTVGGETGELRGFSLAAGGDCNGDGRGDVVIGAPYSTSAYPQTGNWGVHSLIDYQEWWNIGNHSSSLGGYAVAAGDFDGDGICDAAASLPDYSPIMAGTHRGRVAWRRAGSSGYSTPYAPDLWNGAGNRLSRLGVTDEDDAVHLHMSRAQSAAGRTRVRQEWWVYPTADGPAPEDLTISGTGTWTDTGPRAYPNGSSVELLDDVTGLMPSTLYSIQCRLHTKSPFFPFTRWFRVSNAGRNQGHFRTAGSVLAVGDPLPGPGQTLLAYPNPFRVGTRLRFTLPSPGELEARIFDTGGRLVRTFARRNVEAGPQELIWDGRTDRGEPATTGIYFLRATSGSNRVGGRIVLMR